LDLEFHLLGNAERVVDLDTKVTDGAFEILRCNGQAGSGSRRKSSSDTPLLGCTFLLIERLRQLNSVETTRLSPDPWIVRAEVGRRQWGMKTHSQDESWGSASGRLEPLLGSNAIDGMAGPRWSRRVWHWKWSRVSSQGWAGWPQRPWWSISIALHRLIRRISSSVKSTTKKPR
jgi:hypothetical protein